MSEIEVGDYVKRIEDGKLFKVITMLIAYFNNVPTLYYRLYSEEITLLDDEIYLYEKVEEKDEVQS